MNSTKVLLKNGANINILNARGQSSLHLAADAKTPNEEIVSRLIESGANPNIMDKFGMVALHLAAMNGHKEVVELLIKNDALVNIVDYTNKKPLQYAIYGRTCTPSLLVTLIMYIYNENLCFLSILQAIKKWPKCCDKQKIPS